MGLTEEQGTGTVCSGRNNDTREWSHHQAGPDDIRELKAEIYVLKKSIALLQEKVVMLEYTRGSQSGR